MDGGSGGSHGPIFLQVLKYGPMYLSKTVSNIGSLLASIISPTPYQHPVPFQVPHKSGFSSFYVPLSLLSTLSTNYPLLQKSHYWPFTEIKRENLDIYHQIFGTSKNLFRLVSTSDRWKNIQSYVSRLAKQSMPSDLGFRKYSRFISKLKLL